MLDVLQHLADTATPVGQSLAEHGLTNGAIMAWRSRPDAPHTAPVLRSDEVDVPQDMVDLLLRMHAANRPLMDRTVGEAAVAAMLLAESHENTELSRMCSELRVDRAEVAAAVQASPTTRRQLTCPAFDIWERLGTIVFVPNHRGPDGGTVESASLASWCEPAAVTPLLLGEHVLSSLARYDTSEEEGAAPYWKALGHKAETAFQRRARLVMGQQKGQAIRLHSTIHSGLRTFPILMSHTGLYAPAHDVEGVGRAVLSAIDAAKG